MYPTTSKIVRMLSKRFQQLPSYFENSAARTEAAFGSRTLAAYDARVGSYLITAASAGPPRLTADPKDAVPVDDRGTAAAVGILLAVELIEWRLWF